MNDEPRQTLREIIRKHGRIVIENPRRCENLLRDYCGEFRREISVLTMALEEHAVADLLAPSALPREVLLTRLAQRLCDNLALSEEAARWSVNSWAWALDVASEAEFDANTTAHAAVTAAQVAARTAQSDRTTSTQSSQIKVSNPILIISANGGGNFTSIGEALRNVPANSRLLIREGLYHESIVLDKNIEIIGEGKVENIVVRSANQSCIVMNAENVLIRGLTLEARAKSSGKAFFAVAVPRGALVLESCNISSDSLSCVAIHGAIANPTLKNCRIHDGADSGIYLFDNARALIENCDIFRHANDSIAVTQGANPIIKNCRIFEGNNGGIVVWGNGATATVEDCEITSHRLTNVGISQSANPIFRRCKITGGRDCGVFVQQGGYGSFEECEVFGNAKAEFAIIDKSNSTLRRCVIHSGIASGVYVGNSARALVESCNIYDNSDAGVSVHGKSSAAVRRCNIHRNGTVAVRVVENSRANVEDCDLRGNRVATWETEGGVSVERKNNRG